MNRKPKSKYTYALVVILARFDLNQDPVEREELEFTQYGADPDKRKARKQYKAAVAGVRNRPAAIAYGSGADR